MSFHEFTCLSKNRPVGFSLLRNLNKTSVCLIFLILFFSIQIRANEIATSDSRQQLLASCDALNSNSKEINSSACFYYVQGFLAGALNVDDVKNTQLKVKNSKQSTWEERAFNNRVGKRGKRHLPKPITYYCAPEDNMVSRIIEKFSKDLLSPVKTIQALNSQIYDAIKKICVSDRVEEK